MTGVRKNLRRYLAALVAILLCASPSGPAAAASLADPPEGPRYHAFVFANRDYEHITPIPSAAADFNRMHDLFRKLGYKIELIDGDGQIRSIKQFNEYMRAAIGQLGPDDVVVIYYSGHGFSYGNQNWLVPLDYENKPHNAQYLRDHAIGLKDIFNALAARRVDFVAAFLDSCRTIERFPLKVPGHDSPIDAGADLPIESHMGRRPKFAYRGPSLLGYGIGIPTQVGGQAYGGQSTDNPSLFTGILANVIDNVTVLQKLNPELDIVVQDLVDAGEIASDQLDPIIWGERLDLDLAPRKPEDRRDHVLRQWKQLLDRPSRKRVRDFMIRYPASGHSAAGWAYLDATPVETIEPSGYSKVYVKALDTIYPQAAASGELVALAQPPSNIQFARNITAGEPVTTADISKYVALGSDQASIAAQFNARINNAGSPNSFMAELLRDTPQLVASMELKLRDEAIPTSQPAGTLKRSTQFEISELAVDPLDDRLFLNVQSTIPGFGSGEVLGFRKPLPAGNGGGRGPASLPQPDVLADANADAQFGAWTDAKPVRNGDANGFITIGRALDEKILEAEVVHDVGGHNSIGSIARQVLAGNQQVTWVTIAVNYAPVDTSGLQQELASSPDERARLSLITEIEDLLASDIDADATSELLANDVRYQLIEAGIAGSRINVIRAPIQELGGRVRIRFFGYSD